MNLQRFTAVYMDHATANVMKFINDTIETQVIESEFTHQKKETALHKNEGVMHHKEQQLQLSYYTKIMDKLKNSTDVLLFGSTTAKNELLNLVEADTHFNAIKIECKQTDKITENQQHAFIKHYIKTNII